MSLARLARGDREVTMEITLHSIGLVRSVRVEAIDDDWNSVESWIELDDGIPEESLSGLGDFSHIEVLYYFNKVDPSKISYGAEHPRENPAWVGELMAHYW